MSFPEVINQRYIYLCIQNTHKCEVFPSSDRSIFHFWFKFPIFFIFNSTIHSIFLEVINSNLMNYNLYNHEEQEHHSIVPIIVLNLLNQQYMLKNRFSNFNSHGCPYILAMYKVNQTTLPWHAWHNQTWKTKSIAIKEFIFILIKKFAQRNFCIYVSGFVAYSENTKKKKNHIHAPASIFCNK